MSIFRRIDFVKHLERLSKYAPGNAFLDPANIPPAFEDQEQIARLAVDLTQRSFQEKSDPVNPLEIKSHVDLISCRYDYGFHREATAAAFNIVNHFFTSRDTDHIFTSADLRELKHLPILRKAEEERLGIIYLINHSTHFDEFIFDTFLTQNRLHLPLFAAGQNMMATPTLTKIFMTGSYVVLRKGASKSYLSSLFHYCQALAEMGKPQGIFLEAWSGGARTRDGSLRYPRRLITIQGALAARGDVLIQPVVLSYGIVPEDRNLSEGKGFASWVSGNHMARELLKKPWCPLKALAGGFKDIFGRAYVGFGRGRLLSDIRAEWEDTPKELALDEFTSLYAIKEIARDKKIMTTQLAALALEGCQKGGRAALEESAARAIETVKAYHQRHFDVDPDFEDLIRDSDLPTFLDEGLNNLAKRSIIADRGPKWKKIPRVRAKHALLYYATHSDRRLYSPSAKENLVVCGAGHWGFALVSLIGKRTLNDKKFHNSSLSLYDPSEEAIQRLAYDRTMDDNPDIRLPKNVFPTFDPVEAFRKATEVIVATPPHAVGQLFKTILSTSSELRTLILASRGFEGLSHRLTIQMAWEAAVAAGKPKLNILALSGPFEPSNLLAVKGGLFILAGETTARNVEASLFKYGPYKVQVMDDPIGVQAASAMITAYSLYGAYVRYRKELREPSELADFIREVSFEAKTLAMALGGQPSTFEADSPAWISGLISAGLTGPALNTIKILNTKGVEAFKEYLNEHQLEDLWPDQGAEGYYSIRSAYMIAKNLSLTLPHLEKAYGIFW
jgi:glycerol-3-phosphate dehydrogenase